VLEFEEEVAILQGVPLLHAALEETRRVPPRSSGWPPRLPGAESRRLSLVIVAALLNQTVIQCAKGSAELVTRSLPSRTCLTRVRASYLGMGGLMWCQLRFELRRTTRGMARVSGLAGRSWFDSPGLGLIRSEGGGD